MTDRAEDPAYLTRQLITYLGNKRTLLGPISAAVGRVKESLGKDRLRILDAFSGSGVVSRFFKAHASTLASNDLEDFAAVIGRCYLRNRKSVGLSHLRALVAELNARVHDTNQSPGFIEELYAPRNDAHITRDERVFYTRCNARRLDNYRRLLEPLCADDRELLLGPLLAAASVHANTAGVFKGFYKDRTTKLGKFGGSHGDALARIRGEIRLEVPVLSRFACDVQVYQDDANDLVRRVGPFDLAYFDPPYNQHPYGSNYFMLNLLVHYRRPTRVSRVSGIPDDWRRSAYNVRSRCLERFQDLIDHVDARWVLVSFNNEGFISPEAMRTLLRRIGPLEVLEVRYNTFRGSRNLRGRSLHVTEQLFLVERR
jgi:adenine-specific DNA-methyltransferase